MNAAPLAPIKLDYRAMQHFYRGGQRLAAFRGHGGPQNMADSDLCTREANRRTPDSDGRTPDSDRPTPDSDQRTREADQPDSDLRTPEEWLGSTVARHGSTTDGITVLDGQPLPSLIAQNPVDWLGAAHRQAPGVLVKLLDAGERLPVHVHPDDAFAKHELGEPCGKAEAWLILETPEGGAEVLLGFRQDVSHATLLEWAHGGPAHERATTPIAETLHTVRVHAGDTVFVPPGLPHAIGSGVLLLEVQQPTDLSLLLEWEPFFEPGSTEPLLGLRPDTALHAVDARALDEHHLDFLVTRAEDSASGARPLLPAAANEFFRLSLLHGDGQSDATHGDGQSDGTHGVGQSDATHGAGQSFATHGVGQSDATHGVDGYRVLVIIEGRGSLSWERGSADTSRGDAWVIPASVGPIWLSGDNITGAVAAGPDAAPPKRMMDA